MVLTQIMACIYEDFSCDTHQVTRFDIYYNFDTGWVGRLIDTIFAVVYGYDAFTYRLVQHWF